MSDENPGNVIRILVLGLGNELLADDGAGIEAARELSKHIIFVGDSEINAMNAPSDSAASRIGLNGVCEPSALFVSKNRELILPKTVYGRVTVAIAR